METRYDNQGIGFKDLIASVNEQYRNKGSATIDQNPVRVVVTKQEGNKIVEGFFEKEAGLNFDGTYRSYSIRFDAKSTGEKNRFDLKNIHEHQVKNMKEHHEAGAICFLLVHFEVPHETYLLPFESLWFYWKRRKPGVRGTQSIPYSHFSNHAFLVQKSKRAELDYLKQVDRYIEIRKNNDLAKKWARRLYNTLNKTKSYDQRLINEFAGSEEFSRDYDRRLERFKEKNEVSDPLEDGFDKYYKITEKVLVKHPELDKITEFDTLHQKVKKLVGHKYDDLTLNLIAWNIWNI